MPCRYFEPQQAMQGGEHTHVRVPLIREHEGVCHAGTTPTAAPPTMRFRCCNHGYSNGCCDRLPREEQGSSTRFSVTGRTANALVVLWVEERDYAPVRWQSFEYSLQTGLMEPEVAEMCRRAQLYAFCRSYLQKFPEGFDGIAGNDRPCSTAGG